MTVKLKAVALGYYLSATDYWSGFVTFCEVIYFVTFLERDLMTFCQQNGEAWNNLSNIYVKTGQK